MSRPRDRAGVLARWIENPTPNGMPMTRYSASFVPLSAESFRKSPLTLFKLPRDGKTTNRDLMTALAKAASLDQHETAFIQSRIVHLDRMAYGSSGRWTTGAGLGGHTLDDVPVNFARDHLMEYIEVYLPVEHRRDAARSAICPDLTKVEIEEYARQITALSERNVEEALDDAESDIDLCPVPRESLKKRPKFLKKITRSVVFPGRAPSPLEHADSYPPNYHYDPDQVRAMIKIFIHDGEWTLEQFRRALGNVSRTSLLRFLKGAGRPLRRWDDRVAYFQSREFFGRREFNDLPLSGASICGDLAILWEWERGVSQPQLPTKSAHVRARLPRQAARR